MRRIGIRSVLTCLVVAALLPSGTASAGYPGKNGRLAFNRWQEPEVAIMTANPDGSGVRRLTSSGGFHDPSWSANGKKIVYVRGRNSFDPGAIGIMRADGSNKRRVPFYAGELSTPSFSPSGGRIIVTRWANQQSSLWTLRTDGSDRRRVAKRLGGHVGGGVFSPDGKRIAFTHTPIDADYSVIYTIRTDGTDLKKLTNETHRSHSPDWSPDGSRIVFARAPKGSWTTNIVRMRRDGSGVRRLTNFSRGWTESPRWSPNGRWIAYTRAGIEFDVRLMRPDGSKNHPAIRGDDHDFAPAWQPLPQ